MRRVYKIIGIVHSGKKGERGTPVSEDKYDQLIGCHVSFDIDKIYLGYGLTMYLKPGDHPYYDWWTMSCLQRVDYDEEDNILTIETLNSIYYLEDLGD